MVHPPAYHAAVDGKHRGNKTGLTAGTFANHAAAEIDLQPFFSGLRSPLHKLPANRDI